MCIQCVANSVPYVGMAVGGLQVMSWRARQRRVGPAADLGDEAQGSATELVSAATLDDRPQ